MEEQQNTTAMNKLQIILEFALQNGGRFTSKDARDLVGHMYYANPGHHIGDMLSRAVKRGIIERVKKGGFQVKTVPMSGPAHVPHPDQITMELDPPKPKFPSVSVLGREAPGAS